MAVKERKGEKKIEKKRKIRPLLSSGPFGSVFVPSIFIIVGFFLTSISRRNTADQFQAYLVPPKGIEHFSFGYQLTLADTLWLRAIQLFDVCDQYQSLVAHQTASENGREARFYKPLEACNKGILFQYLDAATDLDPKFQMIYRTGAPVLSVLLSDKEGARLLLEKGKREFPNDRNLFMISAYHNLLELKNKDAAADDLKHLGDIGGPPWVYSLAYRLRSQMGQAEAAEALAQSLLESQKGLGADDRVIKKIEDRLAEIRKEASEQAPSAKKD